MVLVFILVIYRLLFYKVLIFDEGFYYQTSINNGKYYTYDDVEKAWINSGRSQNGEQGEYCNIALYNKKMIRFRVFYNDKKSVAYLIPSIIIVIIIALFLFNYYLFFQIKIKKNSFYCRTTPFNERYYKYSEIADRRKVKRVVKHRSYGNGSLHRNYYFYFEFTDNKGEKHEFQYEQQIHEYEVNILKDRIEAAKS